MLNGAGRIAIAVVAILGLTSVALSQGRSRLAALALLQPGYWEVRDLDAPRSAGKLICIADVDSIMQIQHRDSPCSRLIIANQPKSATVHYTCPATGFGRTTIRVETPRVAVVDTQGIDNNAPFAFRAELRRKGTCPGGTAR